MIPEKKTFRMRRPGEGLPAPDTAVSRPGPHRAGVDRQGDADALETLVRRSVCLPGPGSEPGPGGRCGDRRHALSDLRGGPVLSLGPLRDAGLAAGSRAGPGAVAPGPDPAGPAPAHHAPDASDPDPTR